MIQLRQLKSYKVTSQFLKPIAPVLVNQTIKLVSDKYYKKRIRNLVEIFPQSGYYEKAWENKPGNR